jgi:hypothetical protein
LSPGGHRSLLVAIGFIHIGIAAQGPTQYGCGGRASQLLMPDGFVAVSRQGPSHW